MSVNTKILNVDLGDKSYPIYIGTDLLSSKSVLTKHIQGKQVMIVTNTTIAPLYLEKLKAILEGFNVESVVLPDGEKFKTLETLNKVFDALTCIIDSFFCSNFIIHIWCCCFIINFC